MAVQPGLCRTWSETQKTGFLTTRLNLLIELNECQCSVLHGVQRNMILVVSFFIFFSIFLFCFVVAIFDLVHDVKAIFYLP